MNKEKKEEWSMYDECFGGIPIVRWKKHKEGVEIVEENEKDIDL